MVEEILALIRVREADLAKLICEANLLFLCHKKRRRLSMGARQMFQTDLPVP